MINAHPAESDVAQLLTELRRTLHEPGRVGEVSIAQRLGRSGDERALPALLSALRTGGEYSRAAAALGLGDLGRREAIPGLLQAFKTDPGIYVRADAALALGRLCAQEAIPALVESFTQEEFEVQKRIVAALGAMNTAHGRKAQRKLKDSLRQRGLQDSRARYLDRALSVRP